MADQEPPSLLRRAAARLDDRARLGRIVENVRYEPVFIQPTSDAGRSLAQLVEVTILRAMHSGPSSPFGYFGPPGRFGS